MNLLARLRSWVFPPRASTKTWMFKTLALFVGLAVVAVGLYVGFVLRVQVHDARNATLLQQATRLAQVIEAATDDDARRQSVARAAQLMGSRIAVERDGGLLAGDAALLSFTADTTGLQHVQRNEEAGVGESVYAERAEADEQAVFISLARPSGYTVYMSQPKPPLLALVEQTQRTLVVGMVMVFFFALVGTWVAATRITEPLRDIQQTARNIIDGRYDETVRVETRAAEIQDLARSLNRAASTFLDKINELERLTRMQSEFIGNVSHEVRNPIFSVSGYLEALGSPRLTDDQRKRYAEKGLQNLRRLNNLFNDLIEIAKLEYREDLIKAEPFELSDLVAETLELLAPKAEEKDLEIQASEHEVYVLGDRNRLRQVVFNLIDNAIAYTDDGAVRCRYRRRKNKVRIEIVDTGRGIPEEHRERIFDRFYRVDPDRSRKSGGTGLGLSIVRQIVQAHGEQIRVESTMGRGTRFSFELPYVPQEETEAVA